MDKQRLLGLKSIVLKQKTPGKSPTSSKKPALRFQNYTSDLLSLTERGASTARPDLNMTSPRELKNDDDPMQVSIRNIDKAVEAIKTCDYRLALKLLQNVEKDLEQEASEGKILDRNLIIVCLYNTACVYQAMWSLENCLKYMDGVAYNLNESLAQERPRSPKRNKGRNSPKPKITQAEIEARAARLRRQNLLLKIYIQQSALLSHHEKHEEALARVKDAQKLMGTIILDCSLACDDLKQELSSPKAGHKEQAFNSYMMTTSNSTSNKTREACSLFKDEVSYTRGILDFAEPFLQDFSKSLDVLSNANVLEVTTMAKKSVTNWKAHCEGKAKSHRKGLSKNALFFSNDTKVETRSLLGVQHKADRLQGFNIEEIMQMHAMRYKDYAQKRTVANDLSRPALEEKVIYQSVIFFIIATELRFIETAPPKKEKGKANHRSLSPQTEPESAELYHLKALEIVCRYITGPCAYIEHLASRYYSHYGKDPKSRAGVNSYSQVDQEAQETDLNANRHKDTEPELPKDFMKNFYGSTQDEEKHETDKSRESQPKMFKPSTVSLTKKITQQVALDEKSHSKTNAIKFKQLNISDDSSKPARKKVPGIKLIPRINEKDNNESWNLSSDRAANSTSARRDGSPEADSTNRLSHRSTGKSPRDLPIPNSNKVINNRESPELSYFGINKGLKVPKLSLRRRVKEEREVGSMMNQNSGGPSYDAGFMSERGVESRKGKVNESLDSFRKSPKAHVPKQEKNKDNGEEDRYNMYREKRMIVNPHNSKDNTPEMIKKSALLQFFDKEEIAKNTKAHNSSKEIIASPRFGNSGKNGHQIIDKAPKSREQAAYNESIDRISGQSKKGSTLDEIFEDKSEEYRRNLLESIEEFSIKENMS